MVIEAGAVAGYVIAWAVRKARRVAGDLDTQVDEAIDTGLDKLHAAVAEKLGAHPALDDLGEETATADGQVSELTRQHVELAVAAAARKDDEFGRTVTEMVAKLRATEQEHGVSIVAGSGARIFSGDVRVEARDGGIAFGQVGGDVHVNREVAGERPDPSEPGRSRP